MTVRLEQCPHCPAMLAPALVAAIRDPARAESCPRQSKVQKRELAKIAGEVVAGELAAKQLVALALLGREAYRPRPLPIQNLATGRTVIVNVAGTGDTVETARKLRAAGITATR